MNNQVLVNNIKKLCKTNNISISTLEKELFMSSGLISRWAVKNTPTLDRVIEIANYFNVSMDTLVGNVNNDKSSNINQDKLVSILYSKSHDADIVWQIYNPQKEDDMFSKKISSIINSRNMDCFYCNVNNGAFILSVDYNNDEKKVFLYALADCNSIPKLISSDNEKLYKLLDYLMKLHSNDLNSIKTDNFINNFINTHTDTPLGNNKIAVLKNVINE